MKIQIQKSKERGTCDYGWLLAKYSFSFADYYNQKKMQFGALRVLNEDSIAGGRGFGMHGHDHMEIITVILEGALQHSDSMGKRSVLEAGDVQRISAGEGIMHAEYNPSETKKTHGLQIWIEPKDSGIKPSYEHRRFSAVERKNRLQLLVSGNKEDKAVYMHQDAYILRGFLDEGKSAAYKLRDKKHGLYVFLIKGGIRIGNTKLQKGDAAGITDAASVKITAEKDADVLLIEVPMRK